MMTENKSSLLTNKYLIGGLVVAAVVAAFYILRPNASSYSGVPKIAVQYYRQGLDSLNDKRIEPALQFFLKAVELDETFTDALAKTSEAYFIAAMQHKVNKNSKMKDAMLEQSKRFLDKAFKTSDQNANTFFVQALMARELGKRDEAIAAFEKAEALGLSTFELHSNLGYAYNEESLTAKCVNQYLKALNLRPEDPKTLFNLGELYFALGNYGESVKYFGNLLKFAENSQTNRANYAAALWKNGDESKAKELLNKILESKEEATFRNYNTIAWTLIDKDVDYEWGIKLAQAADDMKPGNIESCDILGWGYFKAKQYDKAVSYLSKSQAQAPTPEGAKRLETAKQKLSEAQSK